MLKLKCSAALAALVCFPLIGWGQVVGTVTLTPGQGLTLSTGAIASYAGDLIFEGNLQFATSLYAYNYSTLTTGEYFGSAAYCGLTQLSVSGTVSSYPVAPYAPPTSLVAGDILLVRNGGEVGKILIVADSSSSITLQYEVWGVSVKSPYINQISNNYSYIGSCAANYGIAPGSIFYVVGVGLSSTATAVLQSSAGSGLPLTLNNTSIAVTVNGVTTHPALYYSTPSQLAAVLPSSTPIGTGTITVSNNGVPGLTSAIQVVPSALGLDSLNGTGTGPGVATDAVTGSLISYTSSATPGQNIVLWGSGLGADVADSDTTFTSTPHAVNVPLTIYIGGIAATVLYQGSSGYPGLNQINVTIPGNVPSGCAVSVLAVANGIASNTTTLPIQAGGGVCNDQALGATGTELTALTGTTALRLGKIGVGTQEAGATFASASGAITSFLGSPVSLGSCMISYTSYSPQSYLDAGKISLSVNGTNALFLGSLGQYQASYSTPTTSPSTLVFTGAGGADVGPFSVTATLSNTIAWTNESSLSTVNRAQDLTVTWTGGAANSFVSVVGQGLGLPNTTPFVCNVPVSAGQLTIPSAILQQMYPGKGYLYLYNNLLPQTFSAQGLDFGLVTGTLNNASISATYQ